MKPSEIESKFAALEAQIAAAAHLADAALQGIGSHSNMSAEIAAFSRQVVALKTAVADQALPSAKIADKLAALSRRLASIEPWFAKGEAGLPKILATIIDGAATEMNARQKEEREKTDQQVADLTSTLKSTLAATQATLQQLQGIAAAHTTAAAHRLQTASRQFTAGRAKAVGDLRPVGIIETSLARSAT